MALEGNKQFIDEPVFKLPELENSKILNQPQYLFNLLGMIEVVTTVPTLAPKSFYQQFKLYTDSITTPAIFTLYIYMPRINLWKSVTLS